jgi:tetratricopeptide (TPR) repeat protein
MVIRDLKNWLWNYARLFVKPAEAMNGFIDHTDWWMGGLAVTIVALVFNFGVATHIYRAYEAIPYERFVPINPPADPNAKPKSNDPSNDDDTNNPDTHPTAPEPKDDLQETDIHPMMMIPINGLLPNIDKATVPNRQAKNLDRQQLRSERTMIVSLAAGPYATTSPLVNSSVDIDQRHDTSRSADPDIDQWSYYQFRIDPEIKPPSQTPQYRSIPALRQQPWPVVGYWGWWFVTFSPTSYLLTAISLMLIYIPAMVLVLCWLEPLGSFRIVLRRNYGPLLSTVFAAWAAAHLPWGLLGWVLTATMTAKFAVLLAILSKLAFAGFLVVALRVVTGATYFSVIVTVATAWIFLVLESLLLVVATPFVLLWIYAYFRGDLASAAGDLQSAHRAQQNFHHNLKIAAINPHDADAQYQIGLVYQARRQYTRAKEYFQRAIEIDKRETDSYYQLGRIAREQHDLPLAIQLFDVVVQLDDKHSQSEIWREIGATYLEAGMPQEALAMLEKFIERRPYDAEGLYYWGEALRLSQRQNEAQTAYRRAIEAVDTTHDHRRRLLARWQKLARRSLKKVA